MITTIHTQEQLKLALSSSETHAKSCAFRDYNTKSLLYEQTKPGYLCISTSKPMVKPAIHVLSVFLGRMLQSGLTITLHASSGYHCPSSAIVVAEDLFPFRVREKLAFTYTHDHWGTSRSSHPSGTLVLDLHTGSSYRPARTLTITDNPTLLTWADSLIPFMRHLASANAAARLAYEPIRLQLEEEERRRQAAHHLRRTRATRALSILPNLRLFERAELMRKYCNIALERTTSEEYKETLQIALSVANWIDPTTDYEDPILAGHYNVEDFL